MQSQHETVEIDGILFTYGVGHNTISIDTPFRGILDLSKYPEVRIFHDEPAGYETPELQTAVGKLARHIRGEEKK